jgi:hypothetical protein
VKQCQSCHFWKQHETVKRGNRGECTVAESIAFHTDHFSEYKVVTPQAFDRFGLPVVVPVITGPYFGCILHRQK